MVNSFDFNIVWLTVQTCFICALPFSILLSLVAKITNIFTSFVFGDKEVTL